MDRPYIICHILSALDGKIAGTFAGTKTAQSASEEYARFRSAYQAEAWLYGTTTTKEFTQYRKPVLEPVCENVPEGDYIAETELGFYYISLDTVGEIGWESGTFQKPGRPDAHVIEILTEETPAAYRAYLRKKGVSYIIAGDTSLDCKAAVRKLKRLFRIDTILICGGGTVNWTFIQQGVVDELSLILAPAADGNPLTPTVFEKSELLDATAPVEFQLKNVERLKDSGVRLTYLVS
ncbi:MAG: RibD family protein [Lachnospiraceae bacterium]|nr:RibD family protein [Lachnospiraceae bacterium]